MAPGIYVYTPGVEPRVIQVYESMFIVETYGAGTGQLSVIKREWRGKSPWSLGC